MNYDIKETLQKFWFVILVGCIFVAIAIYFAWDTNKDTISAKTSNGEDVIFTLADENYTADEYYKELFEKTSSDSTAPSGVQLAYRLLELSVVQQSVETTDALEEKVDALFSNVEASWKSYYGDNYETYVSNQMRQLGYHSEKDLKTYILDIEKTKLLIINYVKEHPELFDELYEKESPRVLSEILVKMTDPENPSDTEKARMAEIDKALETDNFDKVAKKYSDDSASASEGGLLGIQVKSGTLADSIKTAAWNLKEGEVSSWVKTDSGYVLVKVITADKEKMLNEDDYQDTLVTAIETYYPNLRKQIVWEKAEALKLEIKDEELKASLLNYVGKSE